MEFNTYGGSVASLVIAPPRERQNVLQVMCSRPLAMCDGTTPLRSRLSKYV
jgi:hypothetical protein